MIFPTFQEIKSGYCTYTRRGKYKGYDEDGPIFTKSTYHDIIIEHNAYSEIIQNIYYRTDRKGNPRYFAFNMLGNKYAYKFEFTEAGWAECIMKIKSILTWYNKCIKKLLDIPSVGDIKYMLAEKDGFYEVLKVKIMSYHNIVGKEEYDVAVAGTSNVQRIPANKLKDKLEAESIAKSLNDAKRRIAIERSKRIEKLRK